MHSKLWGKFLILAAVFFCLSLVACAPTAYKQPVAKFNEATDTAKKVYFQQLENLNKSYADRWRMKLQLDLLSNENETLPIVDNNPPKNFKIIPEDTLKVRILAFQSLQFYGKTLQALASDENVDALKDQINAFTGQVTDSLDTIAKAGEALNSLEFFGKATSLSGPVKALNEAILKIVKYVSDYMREKALKEAIIKSRGKVKRLLEMLRDEAELAASAYKSNYIENYNECIGTLKLKNTRTSEYAISGGTKRYLAFKMCSTSEQESIKVTSSKEVAKVLELVIETHEKLFEMAQGDNWEQAMVKIQKFSQALGLLKDKMAFDSGQ